MNILPKKNWHVRTKENIERVRRDEAKAAEEEKRRLDRVILAENERRLELLRKKADERMDKMFGISFEQSQRSTDVSISSETGHVNLFKDLEREERKNIGIENKEYEEEKQRTRQEWESKMGIQKYLGEGSSEYEKKQPWYKNIPIRKLEEVKEPKKDLSSSKKSDLTSKLKSEQKIEKSKKEKKAKHKRSRSSSCDSNKGSKKQKTKRKRNRDSTEICMKYDEEKKQMLAKLREERLKREKIEIIRTQQLLNPQKFKSSPKKQKYNSMFNPSLCR